MSRILSTGGGACVPGGHAWLGGMHGGGVHVYGGMHGWGGRAWQGACVLGACMAGGGMHDRGVCMAGGMRGVGHVYHARPPARYYEIRSVNERAVRILLECILVLKKIL